MRSSMTFKSAFLKRCIIPPWTTDNAMWMQPVTAPSAKDKLFECRPEAMCVSHRKLNCCQSRSAAKQRSARKPAACPSGIDMRNLFMNCSEPKQTDARRSDIRFKTSAVVRSQTWTPVIVLPRIWMYRTPSESMRFSNIPNCAAVCMILVGPRSFIKRSVCGKAMADISK